MLIDPGGSFNQSLDWDVLLLLCFIHGETKYYKTTTRTSMSQDTTI